MTEKKTLDPAAICSIKEWLNAHDNEASLRETHFRTMFGEVYDFTNISNKVRRDIIDICENNKALFVVLMSILRPHHFGDIQSGESYLEHIQRLEALRPVTPLQQFWMHRVALVFVLSRSNSMSYPHRSLSQVVPFSTVSDAALDALVGMVLGVAYEHIGLAAMDKWYGHHPDYPTVRALYTECAQVRQSMQELDANRCKNNTSLVLPGDLF